MVMKLDKKIRRILRENIIQEGLIKSCDVNKVVNILIKRFTPQDFQIGFIEPNKFIVLIYNTSIIDEFEDLCFVCGWYCAVKQQDQQGVLIQMEAKFQRKFVTASDLIHKFGYKYLFHITLRHNLKHIEKNGLIPNSKNEQFQYPDRIYFLWSGNKIDITTTATMLSANRQDDSDQDYIVIVIDLTKINSDIKFYLDPNCEDTLFTMDNITPQAIETYGL